MKKIVVFFMTLMLVFVITGCGKKPTAKIENEVIRRSSYKFDLTVDDKDMVTKGSVSVNFYKVAKKEETLVSTKTLTTFSETVTVNGLESNTDYRCDVLCTYDKKSHIIYTWYIKTVEEGTEFEPVIINSANELVERINDDYSSDVYYKLGKDIDFNEYVDENGAKKEFSGLSSTSSSAFEGLLDGDGHTIKNVSINSSVTYNGFFGYLKGKVENVTFEDININVSRDSSSTTYVGAICGYGYQAQLNNVTCKNITVTVSAATQYTAGLVGYAFATNINSLELTDLNLSVTKPTTGSSSTAYVGGLTSYICQNSSSKFGKIYDVEISGTTTISQIDTLYYGGLVGLLKAGSRIDKAIANINSTIKTKGETRIGGLIGQANLNSVDVDEYITNVVAKGNINYKSYMDEAVIENTSDMFIGGLIGSATAVIVDSAYIEMDIDIEAKIAKDKYLYSGLVFGSGYEYHTTLKKSFINGSIKAITDGSDADGKNSIHGFDGASYMDGVDEKTYSTIDLNTVGYSKIELDIDGVVQDYSGTIELNNASTKAKWNLNIWKNITVENGKLTVDFE